ncbi:Cysteinyl-tRNA synthetase [Pyrenophora tritici-repentis]|nr:Cysteinyl-tRNA synthetase [Pyrenophora tritici-repentis]
MATPARTQPPWKEPKASSAAKLKVWNSLTRTKNDFIPIDPEGKEVKWYSCGPTVYDDAHWAMLATTSPTISYEGFSPTTMGKSIDGVGPPGDKEAKIKMHLRTASTAVTSLLAPSKSTPEDVDVFYAGAEDVLLPVYYSNQKYEARFNEDMQNLNVLEPDVVTRVTEYGNEIVSFVDKIIKNGMPTAHRTDLCTSTSKTLRRRREITTRA